MIELIVTQSPDSEVTEGVYSFSKNVLFIGKDKGDLLISDPQISNQSLRLELGPEGLWCYKHQTLASYLLNDKKTTAQSQILQTNDRLTIGKSTLRVQSFIYLPALNKSEILQKNLTRILSEENFAEMRPLIDLLERDLRK